MAARKKETDLGVVVRQIQILGLKDGKFIPHGQVHGTLQRLLAANAS
jgi:hypothetical protein